MKKNKFLITLLLSFVFSFNIYSMKDAEPVKRRGKFYRMKINGKMRSGKIAWARKQRENIFLITEPHGNTYLADLKDADVYLLKILSQNSKNKKFRAILKKIFDKKADYFQQHLMSKFFDENGDFDIDPENDYVLSKEKILRQF